MTHADPYAGLQPQGLWSHFAAINRIPRPSRHEEKMEEYVRSWAQRHHFEVRRDGVGNLCVRVPPTSGRSTAPIVILQSHLDMVCERNSDSPFDPERGEIHVVREGDWLRAEGTTLGADNGIGVAAMLCAAEDPTLAHGPLELLFTVDEETGLTGASQLDPGLLQGRVLLNLDSEDDGELTVGCAGSTDVTLRWQAPKQAAPAGSVALTVKVMGLKGGHSGVDIDKGRLNAIKALVRLLQSAADVAPLSLAAIDGGNKRNAIPREARATIYCPGSDVGAVRRALEERRAEMTAQFQGLEEGWTVQIETANASAATAFSQADTRRLLDLLRSIPSGVIGMSQDIAGLVETSNNLASLSTRDGVVQVACLARSASAAAMRDALDSIGAIGRLGGAEVEESGGYPGWKPNRASPVLRVAEQTFRRVFHKEPRVTAVHAGLECGLFGERVPGMDMVSFGPDIKGPHAPGERVHAPSVERFWTLLAALLDDLTRPGLRP